MNQAATLSPSILERGLDSGPIVFLVLIALLLMSISTWAICIFKWISLKRIAKDNYDFGLEFSESSTIKELNTRIEDYPYSPSREVFRNGYSELKTNKDLYKSTEKQMALETIIENQGRVLRQTKLIERKELERFQSFLAISASSCPFIGLLGTVWGIMTAFEGIASSGSTSLATVAPGISEALIATAFGLAAAIPAVIGYNMSNNKIRGILIEVDSFSIQFLNLISRNFIKRLEKKIASKPKSSPPNK